jgi:hypothetical protein
LHEKQAIRSHGKTVRRREKDMALALTKIGLRMISSGLTGFSEELEEKQRKRSILQLSSCYDFLSILTMLQHSRYSMISTFINEKYSQTIQIFGFNIVFNS